MTWGLVRYQYELELSSSMLPYYITKCFPESSYWKIQERVLIFFGVYLR